MKVIQAVLLIFAILQSSLASSETQALACQNPTDKQNLIHLCKVQLKCECDDYFEKEGVSGFKKRSCDEEPALATAIQIPVGCLVGSMDAVSEVIMAIPNAAGAIWEIVKKSSAAQAEFRKNCEADTTNQCKKGLAGDLPIFEGRDISKISVNEIILQRDYYLRTKKHSDTYYGRSKTLSERSQEIEDRQGEREEQEKLMNAIAHQQASQGQILEASKKLLSQIGVKWQCYNALGRAQMLCHAGAAVALGVGGGTYLAKALGLVGKTKFLKLGELKPKTHVEVHLKDSLETKNLTFHKRDGDSFVFKDGNGKEIHMSEKDIAEVRPGGKPKKEVEAKADEPEQKASSKPNPTLNKAMDQVGGFLAGLQVGKTVTGKGFKKVVERDNLSVLSAVTTKKKVVDELVQSVDEMDAAAKSFGFRIPERTRIVINDQPIAPSLTGPFMMPIPSVHLRDWKLAENSISMNPTFYGTDLARNGSVIMHERTHSILFATYNKYAYVNRNRTVQEALADFMSANTSNNPVNGVMKDGSFVRNIATREAEGHGKVSRNSIMDIDKNSYHNNSMMYSNALWRIREAIGPEEMGKTLKPIVDDLNVHANYENLNKATSIEGNRADFEYFLASTRKTLESRGQTKGVQEIDKLAKELSIGESTVQAQSRALKPTYDAESFVYRKGDGPMDNSVLAFHVGAGARLVGEGYVLYETARRQLAPSPPPSEPQTMMMGPGGMMSIPPPTTMPPMPKPRDHFDDLRGEPPLNGSR